MSVKTDGLATQLCAIMRELSGACVTLREFGGIHHSYAGPNIPLRNPLAYNRNCFGGMGS